MTESQLIQKIKHHDAEGREAKKQLDELRRDETIAKLKTYLGKCFKSSHASHESVDMLYIFELNEPNFRLNAVRIEYIISDEKARAHSISFYDLFNPINWPEDMEQWQECTKQEFDNQCNLIFNHFNSVIKINNK